MNAPSSLEVPELLPVRMLNEYAYCPRLAYYEWVQGEWSDNVETLEGTHAHRRVDAPSRGAVPDADAQPPETLHARSLLLSAPAEGLIARLDLLELDGPSATPVDYKRGRVPDVPEKAWEPERVQLCAQGLILRENGYTSDSGVLYFAGSRQRVTIPFSDELVARTRQLVAEMRELPKRSIPLPLVDSPKCPRCSLVGICLPDETLLLANAPESAEQPEKAPAPGRVRRLIPGRDDAVPLMVQAQGATIGKDGERLTVRLDGEVVQRVRTMDVSHLAIFGNVMVTAQALRELSARGLPVIHYSYGGWLHAVTTGLPSKNVELRQAQYRRADDTAGSLALARACVSGKLRNCRTLLRRHLEEPTEQLLTQLHDLVLQAERAESAEALLGIEGTAARFYFGGFARLLAGESAFDMNGRNRRPPRDPVNALLSFCYSLLTKETLIAAVTVGLDPYLGFYHRPRYGRPSLALDLMEEFRPLVADSTVLTLVNNREVTAEHFVQRAGAVALTESGRRAVLAGFDRRMQTEVTHPLFGYRVSYRRILEVQARLLGRVLLGEVAAYPAFTTR
jgi:CRISPR-associated protein Cas1